MIEDMKHSFQYLFSVGQRTLKTFNSIAILLLMLTSATLISCSKEDPEPTDDDFTKEKTIFVYMPWTGTKQNLYDFFVYNIEDMKRGIVEQHGLKSTNLLVLIANSSTKSHLMRITYRNGKCYNDTLKDNNKNEE